MANQAPFSKFFETIKSKAESEEELCSYNNNKEFISSLPRRNELYCYRGFWFSEGPLLSLLSIQKHFKAFPDDTFLLTYLKSGTTWIKALTFAIANRQSISYKNHPLLTTHPQDCAPFLEGIFASPQLPNLDVLSRPRLLASHIPFSLLPDSVKNCRIVYVSRDPKDTLVSLWHFINDIRGPNVPFFPLDKLFDDFCNGSCYYGPIWDHQMEFKRESLSRPDKVLFLEYEEMKAKPRVSVKKLAQFLGEPFSEKEENEGVIEEILRFCSFEFLKELDVNKQGIYYEQFGWVFKKSSYFRKGLVGDWKEHLSSDMAGRIDQITKQKLSQYFGLI